MDLPQFEKIKLTITINYVTQTINKMKKRLGMDSILREKKSEREYWVYNKL